MNDEQTARKQRKAALLESARINAGVSAALATAHGRAFLWWLLEEAGCFHDQHTSNALNTAYGLGMRAGGLRLLERIALVEPAGFVRMQLERIENVNGTDDGTSSAGTITSEFSGTDEFGGGDQAG